MVVKKKDLEEFWYWHEIAELITQIFTSSNECICDALKALVAENDGQDVEGLFCNYCQTHDTIKAVLYKYYRKTIKRAGVVEVLREYNIQNLEIIESIEAIDRLREKAREGLGK